MGLPNRPTALPVHSNFAETRFLKHQKFKQLIFIPPSHGTPLTPSRAQPHRRPLPGCWAATLPLAKGKGRGWGCPIGRQPFPFTATSLQPNRFLTAGLHHPAAMGPPSPQPAAQHGAHMPGARPQTPAQRFFLLNRTQKPAIIAARSNPTVRLSWPGGLIQQNLRSFTDGQASCNAVHLYWNFW